MEPSLSLASVTLRPSQCRSDACTGAYDRDGVRCALYIYIYVYIYIHREMHIHISVYVCVYTNYINKYLCKFVNT